VAGRERGGLVQEEQLGVAMGLHHLAVAALELEHAGDPLPGGPAARTQRLVGKVEGAAPVAHHEAAVRCGYDLAFGRDAVLEGHRAICQTDQNYPRRRECRTPACSGNAEQVRGWIASSLWTTAPAQLPSTPLIVELTEAFARLSTTRLARGRLTGAGDRASSAGLTERAGGLCADSARLFITRLHYACKAIRGARCPSSAVSTASAWAPGSRWRRAAICAATEEARFGMPEVVMGLPSVIEAALLPGLVGWGRTREMLLTGAVYSAADALAMRFVEKVVPAADLDAAIEPWLAAIRHAKPAAVRSQKALINRWERVSLQEGIYAGIDALSEAYKTGEPHAAIAAFFAGKKKAT
jgi:enoyl-CoA hydratase/carnithine racemase